MQNITFLERALSKARLDAYRRKGGADHEILSRYIWNMALCESLYSSLQILEVAFRNATHAEIARVLREHRLRDEWLITEFSRLEKTEIERIQKAKETLAKQNKQPTEALLVSELSFGFWTSLLDLRYDKLWPPIIANVFPGMRRRERTRDNASPIMNRIRKLRNAALHHHSIWHWADLNDRHSDVITAIAWVCPSAAVLASGIDRFPVIYGGGEGQFSQLAQSLFP